MHTGHDLVMQEKYGTPMPKLNIPDYCKQPSCEGDKRGNLVVRYNNTELLRRGVTALDIATDDGTPLGNISISSVENLKITPGSSGLLFSPDSTTIYAYRK